MGQAKRKSKEGLRDLTRAERDHAQTCLHETSHAVIGIMTGIPIKHLAVYKGKKGSPDYMKWFDRMNRETGGGLKEFYESTGVIMEGITITDSSFTKMLNRLSEESPEDPPSTTEYLAQKRAPAIVERRAIWTDKQRIDDGLKGDNVDIKGVLDAYPQAAERIDMLKGKTIWEALLEDYLSYKHVSQSIEVVGRAAETTNILDAEILLTLTLTETERVINVAQETQETDDFFIESAQGCGVPFERVKAEVLEMALGASRRLLHLLKTSDGVTDMDLISRHDKWLEEYEELMQKNGPTMFFNLLGADSTAPWEDS